MKFPRLLWIIAAAACCQCAGGLRGEPVPARGSEALDQGEGGHLQPIDITPPKEVSVKKTPLVVTVPPGTKLRLMLPAGWRTEVTQPVKTAAPSVKIMAAEDTDTPLAVLMTFVPDAKGSLATREAVDQLARQINGEYLSGSVEKKLTMVKLESANGTGSYSTFTDASLAGKAVVPKFKYRCVASGVFSIHGVVVSFTVLTDDAKGKDCQQALKAIGEMVVVE